MSKALLPLLAGMILLSASCEESDRERKARAEQFTTSTKAAPNPQREELGEMLKADKDTPTVLFDAPKFKLYSEYQGEDINQVTGVSGRSLLLCFTAPWCPHSLKMRSALKELANNEKGSVQVVEVNADAYPALAQEFSISKVPTTLLYTEGVRLRVVEGAYTAASLSNYLRKILSRAEDAPQHH